jgi:hypothetical protein
MDDVEPTQSRFDSEVFIAGGLEAMEHDAKQVLAPAS